MAIMHVYIVEYRYNRWRIQDVLTTERSGEDYVMTKIVVYPLGAYIQGNFLTLLTPFFSRKNA